MILGAIDYINILPVYYPIYTNSVKLPDKWKIERRVPSDLVDMFVNGSLDVTPVSSIALPVIKGKCTVLPGLSISSYKKVRSVLFYYNDDLDGDVYVTSESRSSVIMLKIILHHYGIKTGNITIVNDLREMMNNILLIGDKALTYTNNNRFQHVMDIAEEWSRIFNLPAVFAIWVARDSLDDDIIETIYEAITKSKSMYPENIEKIVEYSHKLHGLEPDILRQYYRSLSYELSEDHIKSLNLFFSEAYNIGAIASIPEIKLWKV